MKLSSQIKPISYLKSHAADIIRNGESLIITQNGEAKSVILDIQTYEEMQDMIAMMKVVTQGELDIKHGRTKPVAKAFSDVRARIKKE